MKNVRNNGTAIGRATKNPVIFTNKDGSRKVMLTIAVQDNYTGKDGKKNSQFLSFEGFIKADKTDNGVYEHIHQGDLIGIDYSLRSNNYEKDGETIYSQVAFIEGIDLMEGKATTAARQAKKNAETETPAEPAKAESKGKGKSKKSDAAPAPEDAPFN